MSKARLWAARLLGPLVGLLLATALTCPPASASPGDLDPSFGEGGIEILSDPTGNCSLSGGYAGTVTPLSSGEILVGDGGALVRLEPGGDIDPSFGEASRPGGSTRCPVARTEDAIRSLAIAPRGDILVAGTYALQRFGPDGNEAGFVRDALQNLGPEPFAGVAVQPDGRIVAAATVSFVHDSPVFARLLPDGRRDSSFGIRGITEVRTPYNMGARLEAMALQPDGGVVGVGQAQNRHGEYQIYVVRLRPDGVRDRRFGPSGNGVVRIPAGEYSLGVSVAVRADGRILVLGSTEGVGREGGPVLAQLRSDGRRDPSFGRRGIARPRIFDMEPTDLALDDGAILVSGWAGARCPGGQDKACLVLARYKPDGRPDRSFGRHGVARTALGDEAFGTSVAAQPDGRILLGGRAEMDGHQVGVVARYLP